MARSPAQFQKGMSCDLARMLPALASVAVKTKPKPYKMLLAETLE